jgi:hypothetical protein
VPSVRMSVIGFSCLVYQQDLLFSLSPKVGSPFAENAIATPAARTQARCSFGDVACQRDGTGVLPRGRDHLWS